jgi:hypothetical protein
VIPATLRRGSRAFGFSGLQHRPWIRRPGGRLVLAVIPGDDTTRFRASVARRKGLTIAMARRAGLKVLIEP